LQALGNVPLFYYLPLAFFAAVLSLWKRRFLYIVVMVLSAVNLQLRRPAEPGYTERNLAYSGIVVGEDHYEHFTKLLIHIDKVFLPNDTVEHVLPVEYYAYEHGVFLGKRLVIKGRVRMARNAYRPNILTGKIVAWSIPQHFFGVVFYPVRNYIDALLRKMLSGHQYPIASGLILGGSGRLGRELREVFSRAGILHILAVSGLHVGFVALFFGLLLFIVPLDYRLKFVIVMLGLFMYAGVTGFRPSVCRAASMAFLFGLALVLQRNVNHIHILNITALAFLMANPSLIFDIGTQLSFAAVYGILYMFPKIDALIIKKIRNRCMKFVLTPMAVSFSAQLFVAPLLVYYFHRLPMYAVLANLVIVPIAAAIILLLFLCFATGLFWYALVEVISLPVSVLITVLVALSGFVAKFPLSTVQITVSPLLIFPLYLLVWKRMRRFVPWVMIAAVSIFSIAGSADCLAVCSGAKSILITLPSGERILMCAQKAAAQRIFLEKRGVYVLDYLVAPSMFYPVRKGYVRLPEPLHYKKLMCGDLEVHLAKNMLLKFQNREIEYDRTDLQQTGDDGKVTYRLLNEKRQLVLHGSMYCSIFEQMVLDARIVFARLRMLL
jgi:ComEC/Rec2-related protein